jgi:hypothetical protein
MGIEWLHAAARMARLSKPGPGPPPARHTEDPRDHTHGAKRPLRGMTARLQAKKPNVALPLPNGCWKLLRARLLPRSEARNGAS